MTPSLKKLQLGLSVFALLLLAVALRLPFSTGFPDDPDGVRFIRSLEEYDILSFSPHFPGYPVAVACARAVATLLPEHARAGAAWSTLGCLAGALACLFGGLWARRLHQSALVPVMGALAILPFLVGESWRVGSDTLLLPFLFASLWLLSGSRRESFVGALLLGFSLGVRPSAFPFAAALFGSKHCREAFVAWGFGVAFWLLPMLTIVGADAYFSEGYRFVIGHFTGWGGTALDAETPRLRLLITHWLWTPLALPFLPKALAALTLGYLLCGLWWLRNIKWQRGPAFYGTSAYLLWIAVAQNAAHSRHVLPLVAITAVLATVGWMRRWMQLAERPSVTRYAQLALPSTAVVVACLSSSLLLGVRYASSQPPVLQAVDALSAHGDFDPLLDRLYVAEERPFFSWGKCHIESWNVASVGDLEAVELDLLSLPISPRRVWIASSVRGIHGTPHVECQRHPDITEWGSHFGFYLWQRGAIDSPTQSSSDSGELLLPRVSEKGARP